MVGANTFVKKITNQKNITILFLLTAIFSYSISKLSFLLPAYNLIWVYYIGWVSLFFFTAFHAKIILGMKNTFILLFFTFTSTFILEYMGTQGLIPYCEFQYRGDPTFSLLGEVPLLTPLGWLIIFYSALIMTYIIFHGFIKNLNKQNIKKSPKILFSGAVTTGLIVLSWDLIHDPVSVAYRTWIWKTKGIFFGIPIMNFIGWFVIGFAIYLVFHLYLFKTKRKIKLEHYLRSWFIMLPVISYLMLLTMDVIHAIQINRYEFIPVGFIFMSFFVILTSICFIKNSNFDYF